MTIGAAYDLRSSLQLTTCRGNCLQSEQITNYDLRRQSSTIGAAYDLELAEAIVDTWSSLQLYDSTIVPGAGTGWYR